MPRYIVSPRRPEYVADETDMRQLFGVAGHRWPKQGCPARCIQGFWVHVLPVDHVSLRGPVTGGKRKRAQHRCIATCPECGAQVSVGRLQQHRCDARVSKAERQRRAEFQRTLAETRKAAEAAQQCFEHDSQPLKQLGDDE